MSNPLRTARPVRKPSTPADIAERNRRNSRLSTGPRTSRGKRRSRWNAVKHGLLVRETLIEHGAGAESARQLRNLLIAMRNELAPVGILEEMLVERIATLYWRMRRVLRAEAGEIRAKRDYQSYRETSAWMESVYADEPPAGDDFATTARFREAGRDQGFLRELRELIARDGYLTLESQQDLGKRYDLAQFSELVVKAADLEPEEEESDEQAGQREAAKQRLLARIDKHISEFDEVLKITSLESTRELVMHQETAFARYSLPGREAAERVRMYDFSLGREFHRALMELDLLQTRRRQRQSRAKISNRSKSPKRSQMDSRRSR